MDPPRWVALTGEVNRALTRPEVAGVMISHGTDTLEETDCEKGAGRHHFARS
jgi:L-asparaginase